MVLKTLNLIQSVTFIDLLCVKIDSAVQSHFFVSLTHLENVFKTLKADRYNPWIWTS